MMQKEVFYLIATFLENLPSHQSSALCGSMQGRWLKFGVGPVVLLGRQYICLGDLTVGKAHV